ncbi:MAG: hypothetical protein GXY55_02030 [Phycisphaerae bacterium]|nr:hypothetical protein [Phycisphaerae bacterium]
MRTWDLHAGRHSLSAVVGGATATDGTRVYSWDAENRLIGAEPASPGAEAKKVAFGYDDIGP